MADTPIVDSKQRHKFSDKDSSKLALHHTLGKRKYQASPGDHTHDGNDSVQMFYNASSFTSTAQTGTSTETTVRSLSFEFRPQRAYRISYSFRVQYNGGTSPFAAVTRVRRASNAGTLIYDAGATAAISTNIMNVHGECYVKWTGEESTTQTIVVTALRNTTGSPTSLDIEASSDAPSVLVIEEIGTATEFSGAKEVPTS